MTLFYVLYVLFAVVWAVPGVAAVFVDLWLDDIRLDWLVTTTAVVVGAILGPVAVLLHLARWVHVRYSFPFGFVVRRRRQRCQS